MEYCYYLALLYVGEWVPLLLFLLCFTLLNNIDHCKELEEFMIFSPFSFLILCSWSSNVPEFFKCYLEKYPDQEKNSKDRFIHSDISLENGIEVPKCISPWSVTGDDFFWTGSKFLNFSFKIWDSDLKRVTQTNFRETHPIFLLSAIKKKKASAKNHMEKDRKTTERDKDVERRVKEQRMYEVKKIRI